MEKQYYVKLAKSNNFELVDEYVWNNRNAAIARDGEPRYAEGGCVINEDGSMNNFFPVLTRQDLAIICRLNNINPDRQAPVGQFCLTPDIVKFRVRNKVLLHEMHGTTYTAKS